MRNRQPITKESQAKKWASALIKPREHGILLVLALSMLVTSWCYWWYQGGYRGELIQIDRAAPLHIQFQVDINRAEWPEMIQLPGLGKTLAKRIISDRSVNGAYRDVDDLARVNGIGPRTLEKLRPYLLPIPKDTDWATLESNSRRSVQ